MSSVTNTSNPIPPAYDLGELERYYEIEDEKTKAILKANEVKSKKISTETNVETIELNLQVKTVDEDTKVVREVINLSENKSSYTIFEGFFKIASIVSEFFKSLLSPSNEPQKVIISEERKAAPKTMAPQEEKLFDDIGRNLRIMFIAENANTKNGKFKNAVAYKYDIDLGKATDAEIKKVYDSLKDKVDKAVKMGQAERDGVAEVRMLEREEQERQAEVQRALAEAFAGK